MLDPHTSGKLRSHCMSPWERHCFKDGSYDRYQSTTVVAPWPAAIAPKFFKALGKAWEFPPGKPKVPPLLMYLPRKDGRLSWPWQTWPPNHSTEVSNLPPACMACMCVPPSWLVATPWLVPILLRPLVKVRGSSPRRGSSPLLIVPTPKGWKAEYTLASRMQIHESSTVLALLTRGEARTSDPWICSLMLYHLSYLTTYIHTYTHTFFIC